MAKITQHVTPAHSGGWNVKKGGAIKASKHFDKKEDAIKYARDRSKKQNAELVIHKQDGKIQNPNSYGKDPCPPKDKK